MKTLLIVMFIILFIYLIIHMCSGSEDRGVQTQTRSGKDLDKSKLVLDGLQSLDNSDLSRLRDDLKDLKALLDKIPVDGGMDTARSGQPKPRGRHLKSGKVILKKIRKDMNKLDGYRHRTEAFSKFRVILVQIALILITILMIVI